MILMDTGQTELTPTLYDQPIPDGVHIGNGIDIVTGGTFSSPCAFESTAGTAPSTVKERRINAVIASESDYERSIAAGASGMFNLGGFQLSVSSSFRSKITYSETSMTILARCIREDNGYFELNDTTMTADAQALLAKDDGQKAFRETYGQYYIDGLRRASELNLVYTCRSTSKSSLLDFKASMHTKYKDLFSASGFLDLQSAAAQHNTWVTMDVFYSALSDKAGIPQDGSPADYLAFFRDNYAMQPYQAKLATYPGLDRTLDVNPSAFAKVRSLYQSAALVESRYLTCPGAYGKALFSAYTTIMDDLEQTQNSLVQDPSALASLQSKVDALSEALDRIYNRYDLFQTCVAARATEPKVNEVVRAPHAQNFSYGITQTGEIAPGVAVSGLTTPVVTSHGIGHHTHNFALGSDSATLLVGFGVWQERPDYGGEWKILDHPVILSNTATVQVRSEYDRAAKYTATGYWVSSADYDFPAADLGAGSITVFPPASLSAAA